MATIRKRGWTTGKGEKRSAWVLSYVDRNGDQHRPQFKTKREAEDERIRIEGELAKGVHVPDREAMTVLDAARAFLADFEALVEAGKRERSTLRSYCQHIDLHLEPFAIARLRLSRLSGPECTTYAADLEGSRTDAMATRVFATFRMVIDHAWSRGWCSGNPARSIKIRTAGDRAGGDADGMHIPAKADLRKLLTAAQQRDTTGQAEAMIGVLMFAGLRASELRGLRRADVDLKGAVIQVRQRADRWNQIGPTKTKNSRRSVPIPPSVVRALRRWMLAAPHSAEDLVFPNGVGKVESYANIYNRIWTPMMEAAELADVIPATETEPTKVSPHFALHALRHVACSLWIEQGATPKQTMTWAGHASIQFTMDTYGHLWADPASDQAMASAAERAILGDN